ncbi:uncharacterized protein EI97DRAFT_290969 [Westerdykella ornata]|uniref:Uncharacterized protein n=1 Tax=Westerdykella ornata TaxID=318751 RepID=A0A6A6JNB7_WESOR|nr:uncharacterized protein EI97DRAFT_290969 [Westerdykella ornata]KAF2277418.1 hypothetical protein EI97DRAFT_290969 [Westerdykella ornata]
MPFTPHAPYTNPSWSLEHCITATLAADRARFDGRSSPPVGAGVQNTAYCMHLCPMATNLHDAQPQMGFCYVLLYMQDYGAGNVALLHHFVASSVQYGVRRSAPGTPPTAGLHYHNRWVAQFFTTILTQGPSMSGIWYIRNPLDGYPCCL